MKFLRSKAAACVLPFLAVGVWVPQFLGGEEAPARPVDDLSEEDDDDEELAPVRTPAPVSEPRSAASAGSLPDSSTEPGAGAGGPNELVDSLVASLQSLEQLTSTGAQPRIVTDEPRVTFAPETDQAAGASLRVSSLDWLGVDTELTAVLHGDSGGWAMLGGRIVREGDSVTGDVRVVEIGRNWVRLEQEGETRRIELRGLEVNSAPRRATGGGEEPVVDDELLMDEGF